MFDLSDWFNKKQIFHFYTTFHANDNNYKRLALDLEEIGFRSTNAIGIYNPISEKLNRSISMISDKPSLDQSVMFRIGSRNLVIKCADKQEYMLVKLKFGSHELPKRRGDDRDRL